ADAGVRPRTTELRGAAGGRARVHREPLDQPRPPDPCLDDPVGVRRPGRLLDMSASVYDAPRAGRRERLAYDARILHVLARAEFRLKYAGSVLGYLWSLAKPLMYFTVLWIVFGSLFKTSIPSYPLYLLIGIILYTFVADGVSATLPSIVSNA